MKIGAFAIIRDQEGRFLLSHRRDIDGWNLPGGGVEPNEAPWEAVVREVREETGLEVSVDSLQGVYLKDSADTLVFSFVCTIRAGMLTPSSEADEHRWFGLEEIPPNHPPAQIARLRDFAASPGTLTLKRQAFPSTREHLLKMAMDRGYAFQEDQQRKLDAGLITEGQWFDGLRLHLTEHYLAADNPRAQSGHGGDEVRYRYTQSMVLHAVSRGGTFIDIGCANGYLMEKLAEWAAADGIELEMYGLDISPELLDLARRRLPAWRERFYLGNALDWRPSRRFDYVCVRELDYVPRGKRRQFFEHLAGACVAANGRLILGPRTEPRDRPGLEEEIRSWGYPPTGRATKPHQEHAELERRLLWFDGPVPV